MAAGGTGKSALEAAEHVCALLHHFRPQNLSESITCDHPTITLVHDDERLAYEVSFTTQGGLAYTIPALDAPFISQSADTLSIAAPSSASVPVPGAVLFYTLDGSYPAPRQAALYIAPFTVTPGQIVRAIAILPGYLTSPATTITTS